MRAEADPVFVQLQLGAHQPVLMDPTMQNMVDVESNMPDMGRM
jgi:hypothetical protein